MRIVMGAACAAMLAFGGLPAAAQQGLPAAATATQGIKRVPLQRFEVPGTSLETVIGIAEIAPNFTGGRHTHPGIASGYVMEGSLDVLIDGEAPRQYKTGESFTIPGKVIHEEKAGSQGVKLIATYVVEKGQPLVAPAQ